jgi:hypothetical protein
VVLEDQVVVREVEILEKQVELVMNHQLAPHKVKMEEQVPLVD